MEILPAFSIWDNLPKISALMTLLSLFLTGREIVLTLTVVKRKMREIRVNNSDKLKDVMEEKLAFATPAESQDGHPSATQLGSCKARKKGSPEQTASLSPFAFSLHGKKYKHN